MGKTTVEIDSGLLKAAMALLGTGTIKETVHAALMEVVRRQDRARAIDDVAEMIDSGEVDFSLLGGKPHGDMDEGQIVSREGRASYLLRRAIELGQDSALTDLAMREGHSRGWSVTRVHRELISRDRGPGFSITLTDGTTLAATQAEAVELAEQILKEDGREQSEN